MAQGIDKKRPGEGLPVRFRGGRAADADRTRRRDRFLSELAANSPARWRRLGSLVRSRGSEVARRRECRRTEYRRRGVGRSGGGERTWGVRCVNASGMRRQHRRPSRPATSAALGLELSPTRAPRSHGADPAPSGEYLRRESDDAEPTSARAELRANQVAQGLPIAPRWTATNPAGSEPATATHVIPWRIPVASK